MPSRRLLAPRHDPPATLTPRRAAVTMNPGRPEPVPSPTLVEAAPPLARGPLPPPPNPMPTGLRNPRCPLAVLGGLALLLLLGCQDNDEIQSYKVPHEEKPEFRLLGVIAPRGEKTWFIKLAGPAKA